VPSEAVTETLTVSPLLPLPTSARLSVSVRLALPEVVFTVVAPFFQTYV
jgi:hypothetical protein